MGARLRLQTPPQVSAVVSSTGDGQGVLPANQARQSDLPAISRFELFEALYLLALLNALAAVLMPAIRGGSGWPTFADALNINIVSIAATVVGVHLLRKLPATPVQPYDWLVAAAAACLLLVPHRAASWVAITALALYALVRDRRSPIAVAAASVFLAIAASGFWGPVLVQTLASPLLAWDAALAVRLLDLVEPGGVERIGNVIVTRDQTMLVVVVWCSSLPNLLYGLMCWTAITRAVRPAWQWTDLLGAFVVGSLVVAANALRLALMGLSAETYEWVHGRVGANVFNVGLLVVITAIALRSTAVAPSPVSRWRGPARGGAPPGHAGSSLGLAARLARRKRC